MSLQDLRAQVNRIERALANDLSTLYHNQEQLKKGLDAAELNYRAMAKVLESAAQADPVRSLVSILGDKIDWGVYYRRAEDDMEAERLATYKEELKQRLALVEQIKTDLEEFEQATRDELSKRGGPDTPQGKAVEKYLVDLKQEMEKVKVAAEAAEKEGFAKKDMVTFNDKILHDTLFMISRNRAKKAAEAQKEEAPPPPLEEETVEFGG